MAPRSAKAKKTVDKESKTGNKGKKGKIVAEVDIKENQTLVKPVTEKKTKRTNKVISEEGQVNGTNEGPPMKKVKNKNVEEVPDEKSNSVNDGSEPESASIDENELIEENTEANGHSEEPKETGGRGRKKVTKKKTVEAKPKEIGKARKNNKADNEDSEETKNQEVAEEKPKPSGRGRGKKAQPNPGNDAENENLLQISDDQSKPELHVTKGRKKPTRVIKEKIPKKEDEDEIEEEPKKKEIKGRKNQAKKAAEEVDDVSEELPPPSRKRKGAKKGDKSKGDSKEDEEIQEKVPEPKLAKGRRGQKNITPKALETQEDKQESGESSTKNKRRQKPLQEKVQKEEGKKKAPLKNKVLTEYEELDFASTSKTSQGKEWNFKISSWNVDGIRAWKDKGGLDYIKHEKPDILCLQEVKCSKEKLPEEVMNVPGYHAYWLCSEQDGYAGVGIYTTKLAMNVQYGLQDEELDSEGRIITAEYEQFYLVCTYVPNAGRKLVTMPKRLKWNEEFRKHVRSLDEKKPVIICGDMNVSHNEIDLANPKTNRKNAGFTDEERQGMTDLLGDGFVDTYRHFYPDKTSAYSFWTYMSNCRAKNVGWRLDYLIVSERFVTSVCDSVIRDSVYGSDHCPVTLFLHLSTADKPKE